MPDDIATHSLDHLCGAMAADPDAELDPSVDGSADAADPFAIEDPLGADRPVALSTRAQADLRNVPDAGAIPLDGYLDECVRLEPMALTEELARGPGDFARWNELYATATEAYLQAKADVGRVRARRGLQLRRNRGLVAQMNPGVNITEATLADLVTLDPEVIAAEDRMIGADRDRTRIRGILSALNRKAEALVSIGAHMRSEMQWTSSHVNAPSRRGG